MKSAGLSFRRLICDCSLRFSEESLWGDQAGKLKGGEDVMVSRRYVPVHGAIHDLLSNLDRIVLAIDFRQQWDASDCLPEETIGYRQNVRLVDDCDVLGKS